MTWDSGFSIKHLMLPNQGRTGSPNRPGKFSLTGPHYRAKDTNFATYHDILVAQLLQSLWAPTVCTENSKVLPIAKDIRVNRFEKYLAGLIMLST
jgi:hypothetical protein